MAKNAGNLTELPANTASIGAKVAGRARQPRRNTSGEATASPGFVTVFVVIGQVPDGLYVLSLALEIAVVERFRGSRRSLRAKGKTNGPR